MYLLNVVLENTALSMMMIALQDHDDEHISAVDNSIHRRGCSNDSKMKMWFLLHISPSREENLVRVDGISKSRS